MTTVAPEIGGSQRLRDADGFVVESADGPIGWVEEIWCGEDGEPAALAVRLAEGRRALLLENDVLAVDRELGFVIVGTRPPLLELDPPRLAAVTSGTRINAVWTTTGTVLEIAEPWQLSSPLELSRVRSTSSPVKVGSEWPPSVVIRLFGAIALLLLLMNALAFGVSWLVSGPPY